MLRKLSWVPVLALFVLPAIARAQFQQGDWDLTLTASGTGQTSFESSTTNAVGGLGYLLTKNIEVGLRQGIGYTQINGGGSTWNGSTAVTGDFYLDFDRWQPFIGGNLGYTYGKNQEDSWIGGPEAGLKYFLNNTTYVYGQMAYEFDISQNVNVGFWSYSAGVGVRF